MADLIQPRILKGFRDYLPQLMLRREYLMQKARKVYRSYGFAPIDTPALEYTEVLLGKGGSETDKQLYRFKDNGGRDVALRFDLTVPFARFAAMYIGELGTPFKRYHLAPVWRGENTQRGRYREFMQCDFDTIGTTSNASDIEVVLVIDELMREIGFERFQVRVNNRLVLNGLLEELGLAGQTTKVLRALDKLPKVGREAVLQEMTRAEEGVEGAIAPAQAERVLALSQTEGTNAEVLDRLQRDFGTNSKAADGIARLRELLDVARAVGIPEERLRLDLSIARGLDYYTGTIYETFLDDLPDIGSVCSGGRYDNLASLYTKQKLPGVGASLGLDRLLAAMEELKPLRMVSTPAEVLIVQFSADHLADYLKMARTLRENKGYPDRGVEVFPEPKKVEKQIKYAAKRGIPVALIAGPDEFAQGVWQVRNVMRGTQETASTQDDIEFEIGQILAAAVLSTPLPSDSSSRGASQTSGTTAPTEMDSSDGP